MLLLRVVSLFIEQTCIFAQLCRPTCDHLMEANLMEILSTTRRLRWMAESLQICFDNNLKPTMEA